MYIRRNQAKKAGRKRNSARQIGLRRRKAVRFAVTSWLHHQGCHGTGQCLVSDAWRATHRAPCRKERPGRYPGGLTFRPGHAPCRWSWPSKRRRWPGAPPRSPSARRGTRTGGKQPDWHRPLSTDACGQAARRSFTAAYMRRSAARRAAKRCCRRPFYAGPRTSAAIAPALPMGSARCATGGPTLRTVLARLPPRSPPYYASAVGGGDLGHADPPARPPLHDHGTFSRNGRERFRDH